MSSHVLKAIVVVCCGALLAAGAAPAARSGARAAAQESPQASFDKGQSLAKEALQAQASPEGIALLADKPALGVLIAEGDSWFAYPGLDVLGALKGQTLPNRDYYKVYSAASPGDTVESMAYDRDQLLDFADEFHKVKDAGMENQVKAILLSGGGNDIAGKQFYVLLNHSQAVAPSALDSAVADAFIDRIGRSLESLIGTSAQFAKDILGIPKVKVIIHGYAEPVPDGRPYGIGWPLPGPWLQPGFTAKGYPNETTAELQRNADVMKDLIKRFNDRIAQIPAKLTGRVDVRYVDLRGALKNDLSLYKNFWSNELHPRDAAFKEVAARFHAAIK